MCSSDLGINDSLVDFSGEGLAIGLFEDKLELTGDLKALNTKLSGLVSEIITEADFKGKSGSSIATRVMGMGFKKLMIFGLGKSDKLKFEGIRKVAGNMAKAARREKCKTVGVSLPVVSSNPAGTAQAIAEGIELALYKDMRFKSEKDENTVVESASLIGFAGQEAAIEKASIICSGVFLARELVAAPANVIDSVTFADMAIDLAKTYSLELKILEKADCEALNMGAFLGVARASDRSEERRVGKEC